MKNNTRSQLITDYTKKPKHLFIADVIYCVAVILVIVVSYMVTVGPWSCTSNDNKYDTALRDPTILNLTKDSLMYGVYRKSGADDLHVYYNSCSLSYKLNLVFFKMVAPSGGVDLYTPSSCDELDFMLRSKGVNISASSLVQYYLDNPAKYTINDKYRAE